MSNPNNLIRPPVLNTNTTPPPVPNIPNIPEINMTQLTDVVTRVVSNIFQREGRNIVQAALNPNSNFSDISDVTIDPSHSNNVSDLDKIPDVVRCIREFSGQPGEFNSWKKSVDRVLQIYEPQRGSPKYYGILNVVRNKIVGNADIALESYNTPLEWKAISKCLTLHYADKRDLGTLEYQMTSLVQGNLTIQEFYQQVYSHLSLILNKIGCIDAGPESMHLLTRTYRDKALDTFIRGLKGDLPRLLGIREPADLPQALHLCLKLENQNYRSHYAMNGQNRRMHDPRPPLPPRKFNMPPPRQSREFYPELAYLPQPRANLSGPYRPNIFYNPPQFRQMNNPPQFRRMNNLPQFRQMNNPPPRPFPKPQPRPEPMDVDTSMRTHNINYMNKPKPNEFVGKRPTTGNPLPPQKMQRNFHVDSETYNEEQVTPPEQYYIDQNDTGDFHNNSDVFQYNTDNDDKDYLDTSDIHF